MCIRDRDKTKTRLNFRSRGAFDVAELAACFGGGGHKKASGGFLSDTLARSRVKIMAEIKKRLSVGRVIKDKTRFAQRVS